MLWEYRANWVEESMNDAPAEVGSYEFIVEPKGSTSPMAFGSLFDELEARVLIVNVEVCLDLGLPRTVQLEIRKHNNLGY